MIQFGWYDLAVSEAMELDMPDWARVKYEAFMVGIFGLGFTIAVRPKVTQ